ncbi:Crp/Fnr family transcriptional regulator [Runella sp. SP2]|uniref:Crp/Fnr family transcriptional regulator n=1 Tax=Runella sp. SP2 TaxID=2268026 RepID=UPI000F0878E7|nr:cyclic nucleotide-binding domain-containing protein [Runella sp. SP2]AYQ36253.1 Crp/Fnr family transcriptional regulator [Runella sp. SP2]
MLNLFSQLATLKTVIDEVQPLSTESWEDFSTLWKPFSAKRKEVLTVAGERERYLYFVLEGVQRVYYFDDQSREATLVFTYAPSFGGVLDALMLASPSRYYYETLTPSVFLRASITDLQPLIDTRPDVAALIRLGVSDALSGVLERLVELQSFSAEDRFKQLLRRSPHILQLVPHKYLANYLGMDATNFSKFINRIRL